MDEDEKRKPMGEVIQIDEARIRDHLGEMVRGTVEEALNAMLDAEADRLCGAGKYERTEGRRDTRAGSYERSLETKAGSVKLKMPKLRKQTFETAIIERYQRRESSVEEALIEMYLAGVSVRRVEDITEALWGTRVSPGTVSNLNKKIYAKIDEWRARKIEGNHPYVFLDGIVMKRSWAGEVRNVSLLVAIGVTTEGYREILGIMEGPKEDKSGWSGFLRHLVDRGLSGVQLVVSDACRGLVESAAEFLPDAQWQRCVVGLLKNSLIADSILLVAFSGGRHDRTAEPRSARIFRLRLAARSCSGRAYSGTGGSRARSRLVEGRCRGSLCARRRPPRHRSRSRREVDAGGFSSRDRP